MKGSWWDSVSFYIRAIRNFYKNAVIAYHARAYVEAWYGTVPDVVLDKFLDALTDSCELEGLCNENKDANSGW